MKNINYEDLCNIDLSDDEIEELTKDLNFDKIKDLSLKGIKKSNIHKPKRIFKRILLCATIFVIGIIGTAFALEQFGYFRVFINEDSKLPQESLIDINKEFSSSGVTMKIENMIAGVNKAMLILSFTNDDGSSFQENAQTEFDISVVDKNDTNNNTGLGMGLNQKLLEDGKKLIYYIELSSSSTTPFNGKNIEIIAYDIFNKKTVTQESKKSLSELYDNDLMYIKSSEIKHEYEYEESILKKHYPNGFNDLIKGIDKFDFSCLGFYDDKLYTGICRNQNDYDLSETRKLTAIGIESLTDIRNGKKYKYYEMGSRGIGENYELSLSMSLFENIKQEDLEYMMPNISYSVRETLTSGIWKQNFVFDDKNQKIQKDVDITLEFPTGKVKIEKINISAINLNFLGSWLEVKDSQGTGADIPNDYEPNISLELLDGTYIELEQIGGQGTDIESNGYMSFSYNYAMRSKTEDDKYSKEFLDINQIKGVKFNDTYITIK